MAEKLFQARIDILTVIELSSTLWDITANVVDISGSFTALDMQVGDKVLITGVGVTGITVYDRYVVVEIIGRDTVFCNFTISYDETGTPKTMNGYPLTGPHLVGRAYGTDNILMEMPSSHEIEDEFRKDQGMVNMNLHELATHSGPGGILEDDILAFAEGAYRPYWEKPDSEVASPVIYYGAIEDPTQLPSGISRVFLNGAWVATAFEVFKRDEIEGKVRENRLRDKWLRLGSGAASGQFEVSENMLHIGGYTPGGTIITRIGSTGEFSSTNAFKPVSISVLGQEVSFTNPTTWYARLVFIGGEFDTRSEFSNEFTFLTSDTQPFTGLSYYCFDQGHFSGFVMIYGTEPGVYTYLESYWGVESPAYFELSLGELVPDLPTLRAIPYEKILAPAPINHEYIEVDDFNQLFSVNMTNIKLLKGLPVYDTVEDARADGLPVNQLFRTSTGHVMINFSTALPMRFLADYNNTYEATLQANFDFIFPDPPSVPFTIDWGDGTPPEEITEYINKGTTFAIFLSHTYGRLSVCTITWNFDIIETPVYIGIGGAITGCPSLVELPCINWWFYDAMEFPDEVLYVGVETLNVYTTKIFTLNLDWFTSLKVVNISICPMFTGLGLTTSHIIEELYIDQCSEFINLPDLSLLQGLHYLSFNSSINLPSASINEILGYYKDTYLPELLQVNLSNTSFADPTLLSEAMANNPQCIFYVDTSMALAGVITSVANTSIGIQLAFPELIGGGFTIYFGDGDSATFNNNTSTLITDWGTYYSGEINHEYVNAGYYEVRVEVDLHTAGVIKIWLDPDNQGVMQSLFMYRDLVQLWVGSYDGQDISNATNLRKLEINRATEVGIPNLSKLTQLVTYEDIGSLTTTPADFSYNTLLENLTIAETYLATPPDLSPFVSTLKYLNISYCGNLASPPDITGLTTLQVLTLLGCTLFTQSHIDSLFDYFSVLRPTIVAAQLGGNGRIPTLSKVAAAQAANPQCSFEWDETIFLARVSVGANEEANFALVTPAENTNPVRFDYGDSNYDDIYNDVTKMDGYAYFANQSYVYSGDYEVRIDNNLSDCYLLSVNRALIVNLHTMPLMKYLWLFNYRGTELPDFTKVPLLENFQLVNFTQSLPVIDLSGLQYLNTFNIYEGEIAGIDISDCPLLEEISIYAVALAEIPTLTGHDYLTILSLRYCELTVELVDEVLTYFGTYRATITYVYLDQNAVPTPSVLLAAQTANPQCTFTVDQT
jgi:hypothetical protein